MTTIGYQQATFVIGAATIGYLKTVWGVTAAIVGAIIAKKQGLETASVSQGEKNLDVAIQILLYEVLNH